MAEGKKQNLLKPVLYIGGGLAVLWAIRGYKTLNAASNLQIDQPEFRSKNVSGSGVWSYEIGIRVSNPTNAEVLLENVFLDIKSISGAGKVPIGSIRAVANNQNKASLTIPARNVRTIWLPGSTQLTLTALALLPGLVDSIMNAANNHNAQQLVQLLPKQIEITGSVVANGFRAPISQVVNTGLGATVAVPYSGIYPKQLM